MRVEHLRSFVATAEESSFTKAARRIYVDQSVVSRHVALLESELNTTLFTRSTRKIQLTTEGEIFFKAASAALGILEEGFAALDAIKESRKHRLNIGYNYLYIDRITPGWLNEFVDSFSGRISINISEESDPQVLIKQVDQGMIDGAFIGVLDPGLIPFSVGKMLVERIGEEVFLGRKNPLSKKTKLTVEDIKNSSFVYPFKAPTVLLSPLRKDLEEHGYQVETKHVDFEGSVFTIIAQEDSLTQLPSGTMISNNDIVRLPYVSTHCINKYFIWNKENRIRLEGLLSFLASKIEHDRFW